jgi:cytochrome c biogenesis factor
MPYFAAVFLVPAAFICGLIVFRRGQKRLGVAAMVMAVIGLIGVLYVSHQITNLVKDPFAPNPLIGSGTAPVVTLAEYEQVREGMSYQEVSGIIGAAGQELSRSELAGYVDVVYSWSNENGSNMNAMFQNGKLVNKAQYGLR